MLNNLCVFCYINNIFIFSYKLNATFKEEVDKFYNVVWMVTVKCIFFDVNKAFVATSCVQCSFYASNFGIHMQITNVARRHRSHILYLNIILNAIPSIQFQKGRWQFSSLKNNFFAFHFSNNQDII